MRPFTGYATPSPSGMSPTFATVVNSVSGESDMSRHFASRTKPDDRSPTKTILKVALKLRQAANGGLPNTRGVDCMRGDKTLMLGDGALTFREFAMREPVPLATIHDAVLEFLRDRDDAA